MPGSVASGTLCRKGVGEKYFTTTTPSIAKIIRRGANKLWPSPLPHILEKWHIYHMTVVTFNWFGSKFHLCWLFTAFVFQIWTKDGSSWRRLYDKLVQSGDEFLFLKKKTAEDIYDDMSLTFGEKLSSYSTVKTRFALIKTGQFSSEDEDCAGRPLVVTLLQIWMPFTSWSWQIGKFQPKRHQRLWRYLGTVLGSSSMVCWTRESSLPNGCHIELTRIRSVIVLWLHKKFLITVDGPQQVSWLDLWQWMKHGSICVIHRQRDNLRSGDTVAPLIQKSFEHKSEPPRQWYRFSGTTMGYCSSATSERVQQWQQANTHLPWTKWSRQWSQAAGEAVKRTVVSPGQRLFTHGCSWHSGSWLICTLKCLNTLSIHLIWPLQTAMCSENWKDIWKGRNFQPLRMSCLLQTTGLQPSLQHPIWIVQITWSNGVRSVLNSRGGWVIWINNLSEAFSSSFLQSQKLISNPWYSICCRRIKYEHRALLKWCWSKGGKSVPLLLCRP